MFPIPRPSCPRCSGRAPQPRPPPAAPPAAPPAPRVRPPTAPATPPAAPPPPPPPPRRTPPPRRRRAATRTIPRAAGRPPRRRRRPPRRARRRGGTPAASDGLLSRRYAAARPRHDAAEEACARDSGPPWAPSSAAREAGRSRTTATGGLSLSEPGTRVGHAKWANAGARSHGSWSKMTRRRRAREAAAAAAAAVMSECERMQRSTQARTGDVDSLQLFLKPVVRPNVELLGAQAQAKHFVAILCKKP